MIRAIRSAVLALVFVLCLAGSAAAAEYVVQPGDTLGRIAADHGTTVAALAAANGIDNPDLIYPGQVLTIAGDEPVAVTPADAPDPAAVYPDSTSTTPAVADGVVSLALQYQGVPYVWGGATPGGWDCSGFMHWLYAQFGVYVPRGSVAQWWATTEPDALRPGDLVFFDNGDGSPPGHVGLYIGDGLMVHAGSPATGTYVAEVFNSYWAPRYLGAGRVR